MAFANEVRACVRTSVLSKGRNRKNYKELKNGPKETVEKKIKKNTVYTQHVSVVGICYKVRAHPEFVPLGGISSGGSVCYRISRLRWWGGKWDFVTTVKCEVA